MTACRFLLTAVLIGVLSSCRRDTSGAEDLAQIRSELIEMMAEDQRYREVERIMQLPPDERRAEMREAAEAGVRHVARLKEIVTTHGWPSRAQFGDSAAQAAFLIVQHADTDPQFQAAMLPLVREASARGDIQATQLAFLTDRVRVKQGRPQLYGTQYEIETDATGAGVRDRAGNIIYRIPVVEQIEDLDARRAAMGLGPWGEYERRMAESQGRAPVMRPRSPGRGP